MQRKPQDQSSSQSGWESTFQEYLGYCATMNEELDEIKNGKPPTPRHAFYDERLGALRIKVPETESAIEQIRIITNLLGSKIVTTHVNFGSQQASIRTTQISSNQFEKVALLVEPIIEILQSIQQAMSGYYRSQMKTDIKTGLQIEDSNVDNQLDKAKNLLNQLLLQLKGLLQTLGIDQEEILKIINGSAAPQRKTESPTPAQLDARRNIKRNFDLTEEAVSLEKQSVGTPTSPSHPVTTAKEGQSVLSAAAIPALSSLPVASTPQRQPPPQTAGVSTPSSIQQQAASSVSSDTGAQVAPRIDENDPLYKLMKKVLEDQNIIAKSAGISSVPTTTTSEQPALPLVVLAKGMHYQAIKTATDEKVDLDTNTFPLDPRQQNVALAFCQGCKGVVFTFPAPAASAAAGPVPAVTVTYVEGNRVHRTTTCYMNKVSPESIELSIRSLIAAGHLDPNASNDQRKMIDIGSELQSTTTSNSELSEQALAYLYARKNGCIPCRLEHGQVVRIEQDEFIKWVGPKMEELVKQDVANKKSGRSSTLIKDFIKSMTDIYPDMRQSLETYQNQKEQEQQQVATATSSAAAGVPSSPTGSVVPTAAGVPPLPTTPPPAAVSTDATSATVASARPHKSPKSVLPTSFSSSQPQQEEEAEQTLPPPPLSQFLATSSADTTAHITGSDAAAQLQQPQPHQRVIITSSPSSDRRPSPPSPPSPSDGGRRANSNAGPVPVPSGPSH